MASKSKNLLIGTLVLIILILCVVDIRQGWQNSWKDEVLLEHAFCGRGGNYYKNTCSGLTSFIVSKNNVISNFLTELKEVESIKEIQPLIDKYNKR